MPWIFAPSNSTRHEGKLQRILFNGWRQPISARGDLPAPNSNGRDGTFTDVNAVVRAIIIDDTIITVDDTFRSSENGL